NQANDGREPGPRIPMREIRMEQEVGRWRDRETSRAQIGLARRAGDRDRSEEHTSALQSRENLVCRHLLEKKKVLTLLSVSPTLSLLFRLIAPAATQISPLSLHDALPI